MVNVDRHFWFFILEINMKMWCKKEVEGSMEGRLYSPGEFSRH